MVGNNFKHTGFAIYLGDTLDQDSTKIRICLSSEMSPVKSWIKATYYVYSKYVISRRRREAAQKLSEGCRQTWFTWQLAEIGRTHARPTISGMRNRMHLTSLISMVKVCIQFMSQKKMVIGLHCAVNILAACFNFYFSSLSVL